MSGFDGPSLGPFRWDDPLLIDSQLTEDERLIRDSAREFAAKELKPRVESAYMEENTDPSLVRNTPTSHVHLPDQTWRRRLTRNCASERAMEALREAISSAETFSLRRASAR